VSKNDKFAMYQIFTLRDGEREKEYILSKWVPTETTHNYYNNWFLLISNGEN